MGNRSEQVKKLWQTPEFREKIIAASKDGKASTESKLKRSKSSSKLWSDPDYCEKQRIKHNERKKRFEQKRVTVTCLTCGKECKVNATVAKTKKYCSRRCVINNPAFNVNRNFSSSTCAACQAEFKPTGAKQLCCTTCVPNNSAKSRWNSYKLTQPMYEMLLSQQGNCCALCEISFSNLNSKEIHVDHDHTTNKIRGILCMRCNRSLGVVEYIPHFLEKVATYVNI